MPATRRHVLKSLALFPIAAAALAAAPAAHAQAIKIGEMNSYKMFPAFLDPYKKGWELAIDEINKSGGVLGRKLEVVSRDDNGNPGDAVRIAEELIARENVSVLMGTFASHIGRAVSNLIVGSIARMSLWCSINWNESKSRLMPVRGLSTGSETRACVE